MESKHTIGQGFIYQPPDQMAWNIRTLQCKWIKFLLYICNTVHNIKANKNIISL